MCIRDRVSDEQRRKLSSGALVIARLGDRYLLLPRAAGDKVRERDAAMIVLDHGSGSESTEASSEDDAYYAQFKVPDDLVWLAIGAATAPCRRRGADHSPQRR